MLLYKNTTRITFTINMKQTLLFLCSLTVTGACAQTSVNSGALSSSTLIHTVGELYVIPENPNQAASGTVGAVSRIQFLVLATDEVIAEKGITIYPNPTANVVYFDTVIANITKVDVYDLGGKIVLSLPITNNRADLGGLQSGTYIITVNGNTTQSFKIIRK